MKGELKKACDIPELFRTKKERTQLTPFDERRLRLAATNGRRVAGTHGKVPSPHSRAGSKILCSSLVLPPLVILFCPHISLEPGLTN